MAGDDARLELIDPAIAELGDAWGLPGLAGRLRITFSSRFRTSLGRCKPARGEIRLATVLLDGPPEILREAICHEAAHAAVYELYGRGPKPHGVEWRGLMRKAGFEPRVRVPADLLPWAPTPRRRSRDLWELRCPVCQTSRVARRRVREWRCASCRETGLEGDLIATRLRAGRQ